jgi:putative salt-induced outer membrane protein YdiY
MRPIVFYATALLMAPSLMAQTPEPPKSPWSDKAALGYVSVGGNATSQSLGFSNEYKYVWSNALFSFNLGGVRAEATTVARSAFGSDLSTATVTETRTTTTSTESYFTNLRYDHHLSERLEWFGTTGWERNIPAGLEARYSGVVGLGHWWTKDERTKFFTDAGLGYTKETPVLSHPGTDEAFATFRFGAKFEQKIFESSQFTSEASVTDSFKDHQNYLVVWRNAFTTNISSNMALKIGYDITYKNKPAYIGVDVVQTPVATPPVILGQVPFQLKTTDTAFMTSLVITF